MDNGSFRPMFLPPSSWYYITKWCQLTFFFFLFVSATHRNQHGGRAGGADSGAQLYHHLHSDRQPAPTHHYLVPQHPATRSAH